jgi:prepilin-type N-terminal cleavage/methylation domain-containing protein
MSFEKKDFEKGFLLPELLVAIAIAGILFSGGYIAIAPQITRAQDAKIKSDLNSIKNAFTDYYDDNYCFPINLPSCGTDFKINDKIYITNFPCDSDGHSFIYETDNNICPKWYKVTTNLKNEEDRSIDDIHCRQGCGIDCKYNYGVSDNINVNYGCPLITVTPTSRPFPTGTTSPTPNIPTATPTPISIDKFACSPSGSCVQYSYPNLSECPKVYFVNKCNGECANRDNRCKNERGKKPGDQK